MKRLILYLGILVVAPLILSGCIQTSDPELPSRIYYLFNVENVGNTVTAGEDSITVDEFKITADKFNLLFPDGGKLESQPDAIIMAYRAAKSGDDELVLSANIGFQDIKQFDGLNLFIAPPKDDDNIRDSDFFGENNNYSLVVKGEFNQKDFVYKSSISFQKDFEFSQITLTDDKQNLAIRMLSNIEDIFIDESNQRLLDPENEQHSATIDSLAKTSLDLNIFATDEVVLN